MQVGGDRGVVADGSGAGEGIVGFIEVGACGGSRGGRHAEVVVLVGVVGVVVAVDFDVVGLVGGDGESVDHLVVVAASDGACDLGLVLVVNVQVVVGARRDRAEPELGGAGLGELDFVKVDVPCGLDFAVGVVAEDEGVGRGVGVVGFGFVVGHEDDGWVLGGVLGGVSVEVARLDAQVGDAARCVLLGLEGEFAGVGEGGGGEGVVGGFVGCRCVGDADVEKVGRAVLEVFEAQGVFLSVEFACVERGLGGRVAQGEFELLVGAEVLGGEGELELAVLPCFGGPGEWLIGLGVGGLCVGGFRCGEVPGGRCDTGREGQGECHQACDESVLFHLRFLLEKMSDQCSCTYKIVLIGGIFKTV